MGQASELAPGSTIAGYRIEGMLAIGGHSEVHIARQLATDRRCAFKVVQPDSGPRVAKRLEREARSLAKLDHDRIVRFIDAGITPSGRVFLVMEYFEGRNLLRAMEDGLRSASETADWMRQIAEGLDAAHEAGFVHRDLKPENLLLLEDGSIKILDFGIALLLEPPEDETRLTRARQLLGTPKYLAPEQIRDAHGATAAVDLYALGVIAYRALTGSCPFEGSRDAILSGHLHEAPPMLPVLGGLERIVGRLLAKTPQERPASARALIAELDALGDLPVESTSPAPSPAPAEPRSESSSESSSESRPWWWYALPVVLVPLAGVGGLLFGLRAGEPPVAVRAIDLPAPVTPPESPAASPFVVERAAVDAGAPVRREVEVERQPERRATKRMPSKERERTLEPAPPSNPRPPIDAAQVTHRLALARSLLERSAHELTREQLERLDVKYLDLRSAVHPSLSAPPEELLARIAAYEDEIRRTLPQRHSP